MPFAYQDDHTIFNLQRDYKTRFFGDGGSFSTGDLKRWIVTAKDLAFDCVVFPGHYPQDGYGDYDITADIADDSYQQLLNNADFKRNYLLFVSEYIDALTDFYQRNQAERDNINYDRFFRCLASFLDATQNNTILIAENEAVQNRLFKSFRQFALSSRLNDLAERADEHPEQANLMRRLRQTVQQIDGVVPQNSNAPASAPIYAMAGLVSAPVEVSYDNVGSANAVDGDGYHNIDEGSEYGDSDYAAIRHFSRAPRLAQSLRPPQSLRPHRIHLDERLLRHDQAIAEIQTIAVLRLADAKVDENVAAEISRRMLNNAQQSIRENGEAPELSYRSFSVDEGVNGFTSELKAREAALAMSNLGKIVCRDSDILFVSRQLSNSDVTKKLFRKKQKSDDLQLFTAFITQSDVLDRLQGGGKIVFNYIHKSEDGRFFAVPVILRNDGRNFTYDFEFSDSYSESDIKEIRKGLKNILPKGSKQHKGDGILRGVDNHDLFPDNGRGPAGLLSDIIAADFLEVEQDDATKEDVTSYVNRQFATRRNSAVSQDHVDYGRITNLLNAARFVDGRDIEAFRKATPADRIDHREDDYMIAVPAPQYGSVRYPSQGIYYEYDDVINVSRVPEDLYDEARPAGSTRTYDVASPRRVLFADAGSVVAAIVRSRAASVNLSQRAALPLPVSAPVQSRPPAPSGRAPQPPSFPAFLSVRVISIPAPDYPGASIAAPNLFLPVSIGAQVSINASVVPMPVSIAPLPLGQFIPVQASFNPQRPPRLANVPDPPVNHPLKPYYDAYQQVNQFHDRQGLDRVYLAVQTAAFGVKVLLGKFTHDNSSIVKIDNLGSGDKPLLTNDNLVDIRPLMRQAVPLNISHVTICDFIGDYHVFDPAHNPFKATIANCNILRLDLRDIRPEVLETMRFGAGNSYGEILVPDGFQFEPKQFVNQKALEEFKADQNPLLVKGGVQAKVPDPNFRPTESQQLQEKVRELKARDIATGMVI